MTAASATEGSLRLGRLTFPSGMSLPERVWERRHRGILALLAGHAVGLAGFGVAMGANVGHALFEGGILAALAVAAAVPRLGRRVRSTIASFGLMSSSAVLTHLSGGYIEAHFHFFVMLGVIFLYEDWLPYVLSVAYVAVHHGIAGSLDPLSVYNHPSAIAYPWVWAGIHAAFILGLSSALIVAWNVIEHARRSETRAVLHAEDLKRQLHSQEKMAALGSLVSGLAHEVRTPLTVVSSSASILELTARRDLENPLAKSVLTHAKEIQSSAERINALVIQLRRFHAIPPDELKETALDDVVREAMRLFASANRAIGREVRIELGPVPPARLHLLGVHQVVLNLVTNAVEATSPREGVVTVRTRDEGTHALLVVADNGTGMSEAARQRAFDPLFTTKRDGMGLGLHIVKRIVDAHGGTIRFTCPPEGGTVFEVRFPAARQGATKVPVDAASVAPALARG